MTTRDEEIHISVDDERIDGTLISPDTLAPGVLFVHGWGVDGDTYLTRAHEIAALGCICLTFDMRGHAATRDRRDTVTREDNLRDVAAAASAVQSRCDGSLKSPVKKTGAPEEIALAMLLR